MVRLITRRGLLGFIPGSLLAVAPPVRTKKSKPLPSVGEFFRYTDPTTETVVVRLTNPATTSLLPAAQNRFVSSRSHFLVFSSDRTGAFAPYEMDLRTGVPRQLASTANLVSQTLTLDPKERLLYFLDGKALKEVTLSNLKLKTIAEGIDEFSLAPSISGLVVRKQDRLELISGSGSVTLAENISDSTTGPCSLVRPNGAGCTFCRGDIKRDGELWFTPFDARAAKAKLLARGPISDPFWSPEGGTIVFLRDVQAKVLLSELHEVVVESGIERRIAPTSQFAAFAPNADGSVFVGASRSKAQPNVILLLRDVGREFTLCEHHSSNAASVAPAFSPNSQRVYFQSDHDGKPALYAVNVELLIEPTNLDNE